MFSSSSSSSSSSNKKVPAKVRGAKLKAKGDVSGALEALEEGLLTEPEESVALHALIAQCHVLRQDWARACRHFSSALDEAGEEAITSPLFTKILDAEFYFAMGDACFRQQLHQQCVFAYDSALEFNAKPKATSLSAVHYQLGVTCRELNELDRAVDHFQHVDKPLQVSLSQGDILCEMEACYAGMGDMENAEDCVRRATQLGGTNAMPIRPENIAKVAWFRYQLDGKGVCFRGQFISI